MSTASLYFVEAALELFRSPSYRPHHSSGGLQSTKGRPRSKEDQHLTTFQNKRNSNTNKKEKISLKKLLDQPDMLNTFSLCLCPLMTRKKSKQESQECCSLLQLIKAGKSLASIWKDKNSLKIRDYSMPN